jgi:hypothetical protein
VVVWVALAGALVFIVAGLAWAARLVYVGNLDAQALADKAASVPGPARSASALDWPEILLRSVVAQPDEQPLVLLGVVWPACPRREATLLVALGREDTGSLSRLSQWCAGAASVSAVRHYGAELELRRRQSLECVHAVLIAEDCPPP